MDQRRIIDFDEGWERIQIGITKLISIVEGSPNNQFSSEEYMMLYTTIFNMCKPQSRSRSHDFSQMLYDKCKETIDEFNRSNVFPFLCGKLDELLLRELVQRMLIHKAFVTRLSHFFAGLELYIVTRSLPPLDKLGLSSFRDVVFMEVKANATKAVIDLIHKDRAGEQIDKLLLKNVIDIFVEIGMGDIELIDDTANGYKLKAEPKPKPPARTCATMLDIESFKKQIEGYTTLNYMKKRSRERSVLKLSESLVGNFSQL
ncbi:cullin-1 [Trifolium repens]|nr:cullin-1 [Trifolium repens]